ncbi:MAG TPA: GNAT family N-acetyltransferase [Gaiellaceae bacterium]|nr:GNAT family N-acetyltransferase [Gaiellaceae bacterium]
MARIRKKTASQLDREIREALSRPRRAHARSLFPTDRERSVEYLQSGGFEKLYEGKTKRGEPYEIYGTPGGSYSIRLADTLREIGTAYLAESWSEAGVHQGHADYVSIVRVDPAYKRQGIATALYRTIERHTGRPLRPSPTDQSDEAKAFWAARSRA